MVSLSVWYEMLFTLHRHAYSDPHLNSSAGTECHTHRMLKQKQTKKKSN